MGSRSGLEEAQAKVLFPVHWMLQVYPIIYRSTKQTNQGDQNQCDRSQVVWKKPLSDQNQCNR